MGRRERRRGRKKRGKRGRKWRQMRRRGRRREGGGGRGGGGVGGGGEGQGGSHLDALVQEALTQHPQGDASAVVQLGLTPQQHVGGRVIDCVAAHVLFQCLEVVLQVMTHHQLAFQELQDLARKTCAHHYMTQHSLGGSGAGKGATPP